MERVNFLYTEIKVYPASIERGTIEGAHDWNTLLIAKEPVLSTHENLFDLYTCDGEGWLRRGIVNWIKDKMLNKGKELIYQNCPTGPEE